ncbi:helix-turn-helix domain-containing protein [Fibrella aquatilis]|uniref:Helix-turn-helix domain-containing protein n=1 Tax=Fibrella aquatilis TaxID=2817059 RepID=A0A939G546_9BACT|nr:helix-turn-helix domain-containing protein [Fibrella aquatilis]MBO0932547.1 helix-turn-helix domain-containing protein [Fibrella aquatilis]
MSKILIMTEEDVITLLDQVVRNILTDKDSRIREDIPDYVGLSDAAKILQISESALYSHTSQRRIEHFKRGRKLYFKRSDLTAWLDAGRKKTRTEIADEAGINRKRGRQ